MSGLGASVDGAVDSVVPKALNAGETAARGSMKAGKIGFLGGMKLINALLILAFIGGAFVTFGPLGAMLTAALFMLDDIRKAVTQ